MMHGQKNIKPL